MSIWFFSDPHIGLMRSAHTTQSSRMRLKEALYEQAHRLFEVANGPVYCLGDLFDTEANDEASILQGYNIASRCRQVLAGNHDLPNREGKLSSLQLISQMLPENQVVMGRVDEPGFAVTVQPEAAVYFVPHMATQDLFNQSLYEVEGYVDQGPRRTSILCLHCNYDSGLIHNDASLNLTKEQAAHLLETFDYVLLGHEHVPRTLHNGRLIILGNTHPTSFSDVSDKFAWEFNGKEFVQWPIWSKADSYRELKWEGEVAMTNQVQFMEITGMVPSEHLPMVAQSVAKLWKDWPQLLMVRNAITTAESPIQVDVSKHRSLDLPSRISAALLDTDLHAVWQHYKEVVQ